MAYGHILCGIEYMVNGIEADMKYMGGCQKYGPFLVPGIIRHLVFRGPKRDHNFDNHPYMGTYYVV